MKLRYQERFKVAHFKRTHFYTLATGSSDKEKIIKIASVIFRLGCHVNICSMRFCCLTTYRALKNACI